MNKILQAQVKLETRLIPLASSQSEQKAIKQSWRLGALVGVLGAPSLALADCGVAPGATTSASGLVTLINQAASFLMYIGVAIAVFMIAYGGFRVLSAAKSSWAREGMGYVKNAVIGLVIMLSGLFIKGIVVTFLTGGTAGASSDCNPFP